MIIPQFGKESRKLGRVNFRKGFWNCYYLGTSSLLVSIVANDQSRSQSSSATSPVKLVGKICRGKFRARFQASSGNSDNANWPGYEAGANAVILC